MRKYPLPVIRLFYCLATKQSLKKRPSSRKAFFALLGDVQVNKTFNNKWHPVQIQYLNQIDRTILCCVFPSSSHYHP